MARHEPNIRASAHQELETDELLALLRDRGDPPNRERQQAIACYLSASEGWNEVVGRLGGAFAATDKGLRRRKTD